MELADYYRNRSSGGIVIYSIFKGIDWICVTIWKMWGWVWNFIKRINKTTIALILSVMANIALVWLGMLTLEKSNRPIIYIENIRDDAITMLNSGRSPGCVNVRILGLKTIVADNNDYKTYKIDHYFRNVVVNKTVYPEQDLIFWLPHLDSLIKVQPDSFTYLLKVSWNYPPLLWESIPKISSYAESLYGVRDATSKEWIKYGIFAEEEYFKVVEEFIREPRGIIKIEKVSPVQ